MGDAKKPQLATLVQAGAQQTEAEPITERIFMAKDISNAYLVKADGGDVLVNAGFMGSAQRIKTLFEPHRSGPLQAIFLTQAHADHFGGVPVLKESDTKIVAQRGFVDTAQFFQRLMPYLGRRSGKLWGGTIQGRRDPVPEVAPDIAVDDHLALEFGGTRFDVIATPGGESPDAVAVWMPAEKTLFTGNLFGPVFMSVPNLNTVRGDKPRSVERFLSSLNRVRTLGAELLITGHGEPIRGGDHIQAQLDKLYDAVAYIRDETIAGMNAGKDLYQLMAEITLPAHLSLLQAHGKVSWAVRSIWHEYSGWFLYDSTASLYAVSPSAVYGDIVDLAGGADALAARAQRHLEANRALQAIQLVDIALTASPEHRDSLEVKGRALQQLLEAAAATDNLSEIMWLRSELKSAEDRLNPESG